METRTTAAKTVSVEKRTQITNAREKDLLMKCDDGGYLIFFFPLLDFLSRKVSVCGEVHSASALVFLGFFKKINISELQMRSLVKSQTPNLLCFSFTEYN